MTSRGLAGVFALLSWAAPLLLPYAAATSSGGHGCTEEVCRCAHRAPAAPAAAPCHGQEAKPADCQMSSRCNHQQAMALVTAPLYEMPAVVEAPLPPPESHALAPAEPAAVRHGFARLEPHPPPTV